MFDVLAEAAASRRCRYFAFINSDIAVTQAAVDAVQRHARDTYALSRCDIGAPDGAGVSPPVTAGLDMFVVDVAWWRRHRRRFRDYVVGEACWDNVYAAILMCHSNGLVLNREPLILHDWHAAVWRDETPAARFNGMLAGLDARYFAMWARYWHELTSAGGACLDEAAHEAMIRRVFTWRRSLPQAALQLLRNVRARRRFQRLQAQWLAAGESLNA
jgi:hypothetical protein